MFGMYEHVFVAVTISRMKRWVVELTNHWFICCSGLYMNHCPVTDKVSNSVRYFRQLRQTVRHTEKALSFKHVALKLTNNILPTQTASQDPLHLTSLCVFMWNLSFKHHHGPLSTSQSSATISCIIYNCFLFLFFHPAKPVTVQTAFRLTRMLTQGVFVLVSRAGVVYYVNQRKGKRRRVASGPLYTRKGVSWRKPVLWTRGINMQIWLAWNVCNFVATSCVYIYITCSSTNLSEWCPVWSHPSEAVIIINGSECFCSFTTKTESHVLKSKKYNFIYLSVNQKKANKKLHRKCLKSTEYRESSRWPIYYSLLCLI